MNAGQDGTTLVNELIYVGVGDGFYAAEPGMLTDQEQIDITIADLLAGCSDPTGCLVDVAMTYTMAGDDPGMGTDKFTIRLVPEPSSALLGCWDWWLLPYGLDAAVETSDGRKENTSGFVS